MSEDSAERDTGKITRRNTLKAAAVGVGVAALGLREVLVHQEGIQTADAIFYPLYEDHRQGIDPKKLPSDLEVLFKEGQMGKGHYEVSPEFFLENTNNGLVTTLSNRGIKLAVGDVGLAVGADGALVSKMEEVFELSNREWTAGFIIGLSGYLYNHIRKVVDEIQHRVPTRQEVSRRSFIKRAAYGIAAWAIAPKVSELASTASSISGFNPDQMNALGRVLVRLQGLVSNTHPENHILFFRNLVMADKMLTVAEAMHQQNNLRARIAFNVGAGHAGIEDLLRAGHDFCRMVVMLYPTDFLRAIVEINGNVENFCTTRVINPRSLPRISDSPQFSTKPQPLEEKVVDKPLQTALEKKLGIVS